VPGVRTRLLAHAFLRFHQMPVRGPRVRRAARNLLVAEMGGRDAAVLRGEVELPRNLVVELRGFVQFQTFTSR